MKINFSRLGASQIGNLKDAIASYEAKMATSSAVPAVLYLELTRNCPGRCVFCRRTWENQPSQKMPEEVFAYALKEYVSNAVLVSLNGWGESLILPDLDECVNRVARYGPKIRITTTLGCKNQKALQSLIDNDVYVSVTFDAAEKSLYEKTRKGISYDAVLQNLGFLTKEMKKKGTLKENIRFSIAPLQNRNLSQVGKIIDVARHFGIAEVALTPLFAHRFNPHLLRYHKKNTLEALKEGVQRARRAGIQLHLHYSPFKELIFREDAFDLCCHPWLYGFVNYKGDLLFCDHLIFPHYARYTLGHITEEKERAWNGGKAQKLRLAHIQRHGGDLPGACNGCYADGRYADHEHALDDQFRRWLVTDKQMGERLLCHGCQ